MEQDATDKKGPSRFLILVLAAVLAVSLAGAIVWRLTSNRSGSPSDPSLQAAEAAYKEGRYSDAEQTLDDVLAAKPGDLAAKKLLALTLAAQGKNEEAIAALAEVVKADPEDHEAFYRMAVLERLIGRTQDAIKHFEKAVGLKADPVYADELARTYMQVGRYADAIAQWKTVVEAGGLKEADGAQIYAAMASAYEGLRDYQSAIQALKKALALTPNDEGLKSRLAALEGR